MKVRLNKNSNYYKKHRLLFEDDNDDNSKENLSAVIGDGSDFGEDTTDDNTKENVSTVIGDGSDFGEDTAEEQQQQQQDTQSTLEQPKTNDNENNVNPDNAVFDDNAAMSSFENAVRMQNNADNVLVNIIFTNKFSKNISMPKVPLHFADLMSDLNMPKKFKDIRGMMNDPAETIKNATDYAKEAFRNVKTPFMMEKKSMSDNDLQTEIKQNNRESLVNNQNESLFDYYNKVDQLYEGFEDHGAFMRDNGPTNPLLQHLETRSSENITGSEDPCIAIDEYLTGVMDTVKDLYGMVGSGKNVEVLVKMVNELKEAAADNVQKWLDDNNEALKARKQDQLNDALNKKNAIAINSEESMRIQKNIVDNIEELKRIYKKKWNDKFAGINKVLNRFVSKTQSQYDMEYAIRKTLSDSDKAANIVLNGNPSKSKNNDFDDYTNESYNNYIHKYKYALYEDLEEEGKSRTIGKEIPFNADKLYQNLYNRISGKIQEIMTGNPKDSEEIKWALQQMEDMKKAATDEITVRIAQVTRMGASETQGLGAKLSAFISKHPIRQAALTNLWKRHEKDLEERIKMRINNLSESKGNSPMAFANQFLKQTFPKIVATMITYKCIMQLVLDKRVQMGKFITQVTPDVKKDAERVMQLNIAEIKTAFISNGDSLSLDGKTNPFSDLAIGDTPYLGLFLNQLIGIVTTNTDFDMSVYKSILKGVDLLQKAKNNPEDFYTKIQTWMCTDFNANPSVFPIQVLQALQQVNPLTKKFLTNTVLLVNKMKFSDDTLRSRDNLIKIIYSTKGKTLEEYYKNRILYTDNFDKQDKKQLKDSLLGGNTAAGEEADITSMSKYVDFVAQAQNELKDNNNDVFLVIGKLYYSLNLNTMDEFNKIYDPQKHGPINLIALIPYLLIISNDKVLGLFNNECDVEFLRNIYDVIVDKNTKTNDIIVAINKFRKYCGINELDSVFDTLKEYNQQQLNIYAETAQRYFDKENTIGKEIYKVVSKEEGNVDFEEEKEFIPNVKLAIQKPIQDVKDEISNYENIKNLLTEKIIVGYKNGIPQYDTFANIIVTFKNFNDALIETGYKDLSASFAKLVKDAESNLDFPQVFTKYLSDDKLEDVENALTDVDVFVDVIKQVMGSNKKDFNKIGNIYVQLADNGAVNSVQKLIRTCYMFNNYTITEN